MRGFRWLKRALTKRVTTYIGEGDIRSKKVRMKEVPPSERLILGVSFAIASLLCLTALEIAYMVVVKSFSSEIFAAITLVIGTILGSFFGAKA